MDDTFAELFPLLQHDKNISLLDRICVFTSQGSIKEQNLQNESLSFFLSLHIYTYMNIYIYIFYVYECWLLYIHLPCTHKL